MRNLYNSLICVKKNNIVWERGAKPPVDRLTFYRLMVCWGFEPFHEHWNRRQKRTTKRNAATIQFYYGWFNREGQEEMRHQIDRDDSLPNVQVTL